MTRVADVSTICSELTLFEEALEESKAEELEEDEVEELEESESKVRKRKRDS